MRWSKLRVLQFAMFLCCFLCIGKVDARADVDEPYFSANNVNINSEGYADASSIYINSNGFGSFSVLSAMEWIYISNDNINFYNNRSVAFNGEDGNLYFKVTMDETDCEWRESFVYVNFENLDEDYYITFEKYFKPGALSDSKYNCTYDVLYRESSSTVSDASVPVIDYPSWDEPADIEPLPDQSSDELSGIEVLPDQTSDNPTVVEPPPEQTPYLDVGAADIAVAASGTASVSKVMVDTGNTGGFSVSCRESWIKIDESVSDGCFYVKFDRNVSYKPRSSEITVSHAEGFQKRTVYVKQAGVEPYMDVNKTNVSVHSDGFAGGFEKCVEVATKDTGGYKVNVDDDCDWIRVSDKREDEFGGSLPSMTFNSSDDFWVSVAENPGGNIRTGEIHIWHESGDISRTVTVTQEGKDVDTFEVSTEYVQFNDPDADAELVEVYAGDDLKWTATSAASWISVMYRASAIRKGSISGTGSGEFYICAKKNKSSKVKEGYVRLSADGFGDIEIYVRQPAGEKTPGELLGGLIVSVTKKTIYAGQNSKVRFQYPEGMYASDIRKAEYASNNKKVASVSKGVIRGKKKGKATISVKVTTADCMVKTFKVRIVVDKRLSSVLA